MWLLFGKPVRRWLIMSLLIPVIAGALSLLGRFLQQRKGYPTRTSRLILWGSRVLGGTKQEAQSAPALAN